MHNADYSVGFLQSKTTLPNFGCRKIGDYYYVLFVFLIIIHFVEIGDLG